MTRSLRARLLAGIIGGMMMLLLVFSLVIYTTMRRALIGQFDTSLSSTAALLAGSVELDEGEIGLDLDVREMPEFQTRKSPTYYQLLRPDGTVALKSPSPGWTYLPPVVAAGDRPVFRDFKTEQGRPGRAVYFKFTPKTADADDKNGPRPLKQQTLTIAVARDAGDLYRNLAFLRWLLLVACTATIALSLFVAAVAVRRGLHPLNTLAARIAAFREDDLTARIGAGQIPAEITPIRDRLNDLLGRLEVSFNRERRLTADIAHELRTPLAGLRSTIEVTLTRKRNPDEYKNALADCLYITTSMQAMVNNLLALGRIETHQMASRREPVQLADLVNSCWRSFSDKALSRSLVFENRLSPQFACTCDPDGLSMAISNLLDNAVEYADNGGRIWTEGSKTEDQVEITVANTGCLLTSEQISQVFDCFWRGDSARTDTGRHCGLGLALVQRIVNALGGRSVAEVRSGGIFAVRITLPAGEAFSSIPSGAPQK